MKEKDENHMKGDTYLSKIESSYLKLFCDMLFPGADFKYVRTRSEKHCFQYVPQIKKLVTNQFTNHKSLWIELEKNLLNFEVQEFNDFPRSGFWLGFSTTLKYNKLIAYNIFKAYEYLESIGAIEHHVVDKILSKTCAVLPS